MATQPTLGGTTLPHPNARDGFRYELEYRGGQQIMADGTTSVDLVNASAKHSFTLRWVGVTSAEVGTIKTGYATVKDTNGTFLSPENVSYTVKHDPGSRNLNVEAYMIGGGALRYDVTMRLREE